MTPFLRTPAVVGFALQWLIVAFTLFWGSLAHPGSARDSTDVSVYGAPRLLHSADRSPAGNQDLFRMTQPQHGDTLELLQPRAMERRFGILDSTSGTNAPAWRFKYYSTGYHWLP